MRIAFIPEVGYFSIFSPNFLEFSTLKVMSNMTYVYMYLPKQFEIGNEDIPYHFERLRILEKLQTFILYHQTPCAIYWGIGLFQLVSTSSCTAHLIHSA